MQGKRVGFVITGSYCTFAQTIPQVATLRKMGAVIMPIMSESAAWTDTKFGDAKFWREELAQAAETTKLVKSIVEAEPIGPGKLLDLLIVAPCTGNTLGKIANSVTDSAATMAVKAHLRNQRPVLIAVSTNDGLGINAMNIGKLLTTRNIFFVPFGQDNPNAKPQSLVAHMDLIPEAAALALEGRQMQPILKNW